MSNLKRIFVVVFAIALACCVSLWGCGGSSSQTKSAKSNTTANYQKAYSPPSAIDQKSAWIDSLGGNVYNVMMPQYDEGTTAWVYGYAYNVYYSPESNGQPTFIDMSEKGYESRQLTAIVWGENLGNFNMDLNSLQGKYIAVYGTVYRYKGLFKQMELTDQSQISVCPVAA